MYFLVDQKYVALKQPFLFLCYLYKKGPNFEKRSNVNIFCQCTRRLRGISLLYKGGKAKFAGKRRTAAALFVYWLSNRKFLTFPGRITTFGIGSCAWCREMNFCSIMEISYIHIFILLPLKIHRTTDGLDGNGSMFFPISIIRKFWVIVLFDTAQNPSSERELGTFYAIDSKNWLLYHEFYQKWARGMVGCWS